MTDTIKNSLWITCLVLVIAILCLFTYKVATMDHDPAIQGAEVEAIIQ
jgi:hypothetical protein